ncbi:TetR/AcrR family transcriptional regulator [Nocardia sp. NPDC059246]|uniref:TetR/AcrR family transcriptional regulator n=1 Tax=unclassified Nocardia TaxID=2637762 RepID=UPI00369FFC8E
MQSRRQHRTPPGPKPSLTQDEIIDEALRLLTAEGPENLSLRRLGSRLGVTARTLYGYFSSKDALEAALVTRVMPAPPPIDSGEPWHTQLRTYLLQIHDAFVDQPGAARLFAARSARSTAMDRVREHLLTLLVTAGLRNDDAIAAVGTLSRYLIGSVVIEAERRAPTQEAETGRFAGLSADEFPVLSHFADEYAARNSYESTHYGLDLILLALRNLAERETGAPAALP